jgi:GTP1/Obg family GTP-binding protein
MLRKLKSMLRKEKKISNLKKEYMERVKAATDPAEKQKLLEEMGKRLKGIE